MFSRLIQVLVVVCLFVTGVAQAQTVPSEIAAGRQWLLSQVRDDGRVIGEDTALATVRQTRTEVLDTLVRLDAGHSALLNGVSRETPDSAVEHLARQIIALARAGVNAPDKVTALKALQNGDGGFGGAQRYRSEALDTSFALIALRAANDTNGPEVARAVTFLAGGDEAGKSTLDPGPKARPYMAAYTLLALQSYAQQFPIGEAVTAARTRLLGMQDQGLYGQTLLDAVGIIALEFSSTSGTGLDALRDAIKAAQRPNGSWGDDPYLTALALRALWQSTIVTPPTKAEISASVRDADTLAPIAGAQLRLGDSAELQALSAADGRVVLANVPPGSYTPVIRKTGYTEATSTALTLTAGQRLDLGVVSLHRLPTTAVLRGQVTDVRDGSPLSGAEVAISGAVTATVFTGPDGRYEWSGATAGSIQIRVSRDGFRAAQGTGELVVGEVLLFSPALYAGDLTPPDSATLTGQVVSASDAAPIASALIQVGSKQAHSDATGRFSLTELPAGAFQAAVSANGYVTGQVEGSLAIGVNDAGLIRLQPATAGNTSTLSGRVTDAANGTALAGATVEITGASLRTTSGADGSYSLTSITSVPFTAAIAAPGYATQTLSAGQNGHGSFRADVGLVRLAGGNVVLESVVSSAPEYDPYGEVAVLGTVRNNGGTETGLIFNAVVYDAQGKIVRDVPAVRANAQTTLADTILAIPANGTRAITILWGNYADLPGDYSVLFRGLDPSGRVALEGTTTYRVRGLKRLGGGITADPPLLQAGLGQAVNLSAVVSNLGNVAIGAGEAELAIKLVNADNKPPYPGQPEALPNLGGTVTRPMFATRDNEGNLYTFNYNTSEIVRVTPTGATSVVVRLTVTSKSGAWKGYLRALRFHPDGALRVAWSEGWINTVSLTAPLANVDERTSVTAVTAYGVDAAGNEYFAGTYNGRYRVVKRSGGTYSALADGGNLELRNLAFGPGDNLYASTKNGDVMRIDRTTGLREPFASGFTSPSGILFEADGTLYVAESTTGKIKKRTPAGQVSDFASGLDNPQELRQGRDGAIYVLNAGDGSIRRVDASGAVSMFNQGMVNQPTSVRFDRDGNLLSIAKTVLRRRQPDGSTQTLVTGLTAGNDVLALPDGSLIIADGSRLLSWRDGTQQVLLQNAAMTFKALSIDDAGSVLVMADSSGRNGIYRYTSGSLSPVVEAVGAPIDSDVTPQGDMLVLDNTALWQVSRTRSEIRRVADVTSPTGLAVGPDGAVYVHEYTSTRRVQRIDAQTGAKTTVATNLAGLRYDFDVDATGRIWFVRNTDRALVHYSPATAATVKIADAATTNDYRLSLDADGAPYTLTGTELYRFAGGVGVRVGTASFLGTDHAGKIHWLTDGQLYTLSGSAAVVAHTFATAPDKFIGVNGTEVLASFDSQVRYDFTTLGATTLQHRVQSAKTVKSMATLGEAVLFVDDGTRLMRWQSATGVEIAAASGGLHEVRRVGNEIWVSHTSTLVRLNANGTFTTAFSTPDLVLNEYVLFDQSADGTLAMVNPNTQEQILYRNGTRVASYAPYVSARNFLQRPDGKWWLVTGKSMIEVDERGFESRILNRILINDVAQTPDGNTFAVKNGNVLYRVNAAGDLTAVAYAMDTWPANPSFDRLVTNGVDTYVLSTENALQLYQRQGDYLRPHSSGVAEVNDVAVHADGRVFVADKKAQSVGVLENGGYRAIVTGVGEPQAVALSASDQLVVPTFGRLVISDLGGRKTPHIWASTENTGAVVTPDGIVQVPDHTNNRIRQFKLKAPAPSIAPGTVVHTARRALPALGLSENRNVALGNWMPPVGGDYEVIVTAVDSSVGGRLVTGVHVGPHANSNMNAEPSQVTPESAQVTVKTHVEGADFSSITRIDPSQIELATPQTIYPNGLGIDANGGIWYLVVNPMTRELYYVTDTGAPRHFGSDFQPVYGDLPIDVQQRAYASKNAASAGRSDIWRYTATGTAEKFVTIDGAIASMTIDEADRLYVLTPGKIWRVSPDRTVEEYASYPQPNVPWGITRDGEGNVYVQLKDDIILLITPQREVSVVLAEAKFEYERVNIAGSCGQGLFFTPATYARLGQAGEEYTLAQLLPSGQIGPVLNGAVVSDDLTDIDFVAYNRFSGYLYLLSEARGVKIYKMPAACGAIDVDLHIVFEPEHVVQAPLPTPAQTITRPDGAKEIVWSLREVDKLGTSVQFQTSLSSLRRGEDRAVAREAFLEFHNSFVPGSVRIPVAVPQVHVVDLVQLSITTDNTRYPQHTPVQIDVLAESRDSVAKEGHLLVAIVDASGDRVETLVDRDQRFLPGESLHLNPPFNTGTTRIGSYAVLARVTNRAGEVTAESSTPFEIIAGGDGTAHVTATVSTDRLSYAPRQSVLITANLHNDSANVGWRNLKVIETVTGPSGAEFWHGEQALANLEPETDARLTFTLPLGAAAPGEYSIRQEVRAEDGTLLSSPSTTFTVEAGSGNQSVTGTLRAEPATVSRGTPVQLTANVTHRGNTALASVPLRLRLVDPEAANASVAEWTTTRDLAVGGSAEWAESWSTATVAPKTYLAVLSVESNGDSVVLAQQSVRVQAVSLAGTLTATPQTVARGEPLTLAARVTNSGNVGATAVPLQLRVIDAQTGTSLRDWRYTSDIAAGASVSKSEVLATQTLPLGSYTAQWIVTIDGAEQSLGEAAFTVSGAQVSGTLAVSPSEVDAGTPVALNGIVRNTGNVPATALPVRLEVRRADTQAVLTSWNDTSDVAAQGTLVFDRQFSTVAIAAGQYEAVLMASLEGNWQTLATTRFTVRASQASVEMTMAVERDARVLVLAACAPGAASDCEATKKKFIEDWLTERGVTHRVVLDPQQFVAEMRCGRYNVYWLSGGSFKLANADAQELREVIYRGDGLVIDGAHDNRNNQLDEVGGFAFRGKLSEQNQDVQGMGTLFPNVRVNTFGRGLRLSPTTAQAESIFWSSKTPAIISNTYGQGHALTYAFDLYEVLLRNGSEPASAQLFDSGLIYAAPTVVAPDYAGGGLVPVTTTVTNQGDALDLRLLTQVTTPATVEKALPEPTASTNRSATWDFNLPVDATRTFDVEVRVPLAATSSSVRSDLSQRNGSTLAALSNRVHNLPLRDVAVQTQQLISELNAAALHGGDAAARRRAVTAIEAARNLDQQGNASGAIVKWMDAAGEIARIRGVVTSRWRLAVARLLEVSQHRGCSAKVVEWSPLSIEQQVAQAAQHLLRTDAHSLCVTAGSAGGL
ncbi:carboxypeptidase regulatory-like domain-containing protein [Tahibacter amnicola]|uniref:Carboxypeptidase regulatory-like domain-containing protein n=1 Tax=Tahibacter amnicola TaxID=2976241 RepID=A0ABY6BKK9_9GAMM|nr:carboxypeptidase regulatory-like domain-containing protein [Tahibacter amnicola]UXI70439.1 carboxypeptidase regulatory-like domain-containing protein [Tahibacter amnicola]